VSAVSTLYVACHSHTDIGYTDYQDVCFRQHGEFVDQALDLVETTASEPEEARFRWTCEVTGPLVRWLRGASESQRERLRAANAAGLVDVAAMQYNLTPLLTPEQMARSLYPVRELREEHGLRVTTAMQDDVNGVSWRFADLLGAIGVDFLTLSVNQVRGGAPRPFPGAFWWEAPAGGRLLVWNGLHYLWGRSVAKLGDWRYVEEALPAALARIEGGEGQPQDVLYCEATHPMRVDNGPPDRRMVDFVRDWNAGGRSPRIVLTTPTEFGARLRAEHADALPVRRGDWTDFWSDGVASSAYETGLNRTTHELAAAAEVLEAWLRAEGGGVLDTARLARLQETMTLYDEHTWGAFSSTARPEALWTRAQWSRKSSYAYEAAMEAHDVLARAATALGASRGERGPEGRFNLGEIPHEEAYPDSGSREWLVVNTLPWPREVVVDEPELRAGGAPQGVLDMFFPRDVPWGGARPLARVHQARAELPGFGVAWVPFAAAPEAADLAVGAHAIENEHYRVVLDPASGAIASWWDKALERELAGSHDGWRPAQYVYETVDSPTGRAALFHEDWAHPDFGWWPRDTPFAREAATVAEIGEARLEGARASIGVALDAPGTRGARCRYTLESGRKVLAVDWLLDKEHVTSPEAVYVAFPFALNGAAFRADLNGIACEPDEDQLPGSVRDWYPLRRWVDVSDGACGVTLAPLDAPLVQLGGITTGRDAPRLQADHPTIMSWALNNHWMVNFKASQGGQIGLRYRLTSHAGPCDPAAAERFAAGEAVPALVLRDYLRSGPASESFLEVSGPGEVEAWLKPAEDGDGIVVRVSNPGTVAQQLALRFPGASPRGAWRVSPIEQDGEALPVEDGVVRLDVAGRALDSLRVRF
jgi:hypothetical protein